MPASRKIVAPESKISSPLPGIEKGVFILLLLSLALRWALVFRGGQYYFSDEGRYETSRAAASLLRQGDFGEAYAQLFILPEHLGFKFIGVLPALVETFTVESLVIPGLFFSLFSVLNLYLLYLISKRAGATQNESLYALILASASMSLLYYARHIMPYDPAMTFGLLAVYAAMDERSPARVSLACGALGFLCFITYNGYWTLAAVAMLLRALRRRETIAGFLRTSTNTALGFIALALVLVGLSSLAGINLLGEYQTFSTTVSQGDYTEGWSLPFEYFWHAERFVIIALVALSVFALFKQQDRKHPVLRWAGAAVFIYLCLFIFSIFFHSFVVYGRLARQMTPFLIVLAASGLSRLEDGFSSGPKLVRILLAGIVLQAGWNYKTSYELAYPRDFAWEAQMRHPGFEFSEKRLAFGAPTLCQNNGYILEYVKHFAVPPGANPPVQGQILLSAPHPDNFPPYQYEGYTLAERQTFRELKPEMRLYRADATFMSDSNPTWTTMKNCVVKEE